MRFLGVELYFDNLHAARRFYIETLGLEVSEDRPRHYAKFDFGDGFVCLERKGMETYPSRDKGVLSFEVRNLARAVEAIGRERVVAYRRARCSRPPWGALHDPEGHSVVLIEERRGART